MDEIIQNNIKDSDLAYDVKLRIDFIPQVTDDKLDSIDDLLSSHLLKIGIGFHSARGRDFIEAALLDFGKTPEFHDLRKCVSEILMPYEDIIKKVSYDKN